MYQRSVLLIAILMLSGCGYVARGAWEEFKILSRREKIQTLLETGKLSDEDRMKLKFVLEAREFGATTGLNVGESYSQYAEVDTSALVWVLAAAPRLKLEPKTWWFPVVGTVPYKGYFRKEDALRLKDELEAEGFDVIVRGSSAFSTLGWFNDPVLSTMLRGDEISLVDTVLHEILHRTVWVPGDVDFNESLANFVGGTLALRFFESKGDSARVEKARQRLEEEFAFGEFIAEVSARLEALYAEKRDESALVAAKSELLEELRAKWTARGPAEHYSLEKFPLNNASVLSLRTYLREFGLFNRLYERCDREPQRFLEAVKRLISERKNKLFDELRSFLEQPEVCAVSSSH